VTFHVTSGMTYDIAVDGKNGAAGGGELNLSQVTPDPAPAAGPGNDNFAGALVLSGVSGSVSADTSGATREAGEPTIVGNAGGHSVWYGWTAPASGSVSLDTHGSAFDTTLAVYTGSSLPGLTQVVEDDDSARSEERRVG